jgi:2-polyprenyl-6-methoxyphenol hydroxylase-like FAD-dependent oxidoreductase
MNVAGPAASGRGAALRVAIAGAGLGGLCLAQGLARAGAEVTVYERDATLDSRRQGYRLHVDARAGLALQRCLPPDLFDAFLATCGQPGRCFTVLSERLRVLHRVSGDPATDPMAPASLSTSVHRQTLREILAAFVDIRFGRAVAGFSAYPDSVTVHLADGESVRADLLVGADGVGSAVRQRYLPDASTVDTGSRCVYGRTPLTAEVLELLPEPVLDGFTAVAGGATGMALGTVRFRTPPSSVVAPGLRLTPVRDYLMWALAGPHAGFPLPDDELGGLDAAGLHRMVMGMVRDWHPRLRGLVARAEVTETFLVRVRASVPVPAWPPSRVTVLGDAIHAMSPARGSGANTALRDASRLCDALTSGDEVLDAVGRYEAEMREYGYAAVEASRRAEAETGTRRNRLAFWLYRRLAR